MSKHPPKDKYVSVDWFRRNRDWSSRVIHDMHHWQRPYSADVKPSKMTFRSVVVGGMSAAQTGTVRNTGYRPLRILAITPVGEFLVTHKAPLVLQPGETFSISVIFNPQHVGLCSGGVYIDTGDAAGKEFIEFLGYGLDGDTPPGPDTDPTISISDGVLEDYGVETDPTLSISDAVIEDYTAPSVTASTTSMIFSETVVGEQSLPQSITFTNAGLLGVELVSLTLPSGFIQTGGTLTLGGTLAAESTGTIILRFAPEEAGEHSGSLVALFDDESEVIISLSGSADEVPITLTRLKTVGNQFLNQETDEEVVLRSANWFGAEGTNYTPHGTWLRPWRDIIDQIKGLGFNCIRLPFSGAMVGATPPTSVIDFDKNPEFVGLTSLEIFDLILDYCLEQNIYVVLDHHRRQAGDGAYGSPIGSGYTKAQWIATWTTMANRYKDHMAVVGADIHNEPHDLTWNAWADLAEECGNAIQAIAPEWIIFVEGVGAYDDEYYWWGNALGGVRDRPVVLNVQNKLAYSPHEYGQSVGGQAWLAYDNQTPPANWPNNLYAVWDNHWSFIFYENIAPIWIGEMGGQFGLDGNGNLTVPHRIPETAWMETLITHLNGKRTAASSPIGKRMSFAYWSFNPNSADTGGLLQDDWVTVQQPKMNLLAPLFN